MTKVTKREWKQEMGIFCIALSTIEKQDGHRYDIWSDVTTKQLSLIDNECGVKETVVIEKCDIDTFRQKLRLLIAKGNKGNQT